MTVGMALDAAAAAPGGASRAARGWRVVRVGLALAGLVSLASAPWWGPMLLSHLDYFHVRRVEIEGVRFARANELARLLDVDTTESVWQPLEPMAERVAGHVMVDAADVRRRLPGTLVVAVREREPVAMLPRQGRLVVVDVAGRALPIDLARTPLDLPLVAAADSAVLRVLDAVRRDAPALHARISSARRAGPDELRFQVGAVLVRTRPEVTVARFLDILPVEADAAQQALRVVELDLRFRDQVIARQP